MKKTTFIMTCAALMVLGVTQASAQLRGGRGDNARRENVRNDFRGDEVSRGNNLRGGDVRRGDNLRGPDVRRNDNLRGPDIRRTPDRGPVAMRPRPVAPRPVPPPRPIPVGYEDRVVYDGTYWCYLRDGRWYSYDHYIEPATYYSRPLSEFGTALIVGTVVGCLISALAR